MIIAVTGANGWLGSSICQTLLEKGHCVRRVMRKRTEKGDFEWDALSADVKDLDRALQGADGVVHSAAYVHRRVETAEEIEKCFTINSRGTELLLGRAERQGVRRFVFASTVALYRWGNGPCAEDGEIDGDDSYAQSKREAERVIQHSSLDWRIARLATIFGHGDRGNFYLLSQAIKRRLFFIPGYGEAQKSILPIHKASELMVRLATAVTTPHRIFNFASPESPTLREICDAFSEVLEVSRVRRMPISIFSLLARAGDMIRPWIQSFPIHSALLRKLTTDTRVRTERQESTFNPLQWKSFRQELAVYANAYK